MAGEDGGSPSSPPRKDDTKRGINADIWIAGAVAAFTVDLIVYPLDTIKTRLQSPNYRDVYRNSSDTAFRPAMFRGVYQGVGSVIIATLPSSGAFFTTYEAVKAILSDLPAASWQQRAGSANHTRLLPEPLIHASASATAELVSCAILTPAEVIKQNAQMVDTAAASSVASSSSFSASASASSSSTNATLATLRRFRANPLALWRGYAALAGRNLPFTALQFPLFERLRTALREHRDARGTRSHTLLEAATITAVSAGAGGSVAAVLTTPIDVVKTRIMLAAAEEASRGEEKKKMDRGKVEAQSAGQQQQQQQQQQRGDAGLVDATGRKLQAAKEQVVESAKSVAAGRQGQGGGVGGSRQSSLQIAREILREHGVKGLFRGGALRGLWTMLGSGLYLGVYETGRIYLAERRGEKLDVDDLA